MPKLSLDLRTLRVESFATLAPGTGRRGTVHGHYTGKLSCIQTQCPVASCDLTCYVGCTIYDTVRP